MSRLREIACKRRQASAMHNLALSFAIKPGRERDANNVSKEAAILDAEWRQMLADLQAKMEMDMDAKQARDMIAEIGAWLAEGAPEAAMDTVYENVAADLARELARNLLTDAGAEAMSGCPLCQG